jgi:ubiquinone/menaquinone biosynthesis C-methylase UbiE
MYLSMRYPISFICKECSAGLLPSSGSYVCKACSKEYKVQAMVAMLGSSGSYWEIIPQNQMTAFLDEVKRLGWKDAINYSSDQKIREQYLWTECPSRADGTYYLPISSKSTVLDLGSGWGSYTFPLSKRAGTVVSADSCLESLKFISLRAAQDNIENILAAHIDPLDFGKLPFGDGQFDCVIMNGVLEWVGSFLKKGDPKHIQERCLKEVNRVLKPGGTLFIGMENRFGFKYLLGAPDDHLLYYSPDKKIAYTSLFPRFIANIVTKTQLGISYRTYTHSISGHTRMLKQAGFRKLDFYYPENGYRSVNTNIIPIPSPSADRAMTERYGNNAVFKLLGAIKGKHYFCDSFFIIGEKTS